jgi:hypothetical protein
VKRQTFAAVSTAWTGFAAGQARREVISIQLGVAHNLHDKSEFLCFNPSAVKAAN